jgi:hypothetical protein
MLHMFNAILKYTKQIMFLNSNLILSISRFNKNNPLIHHKLHLISLSYAPLMKSIPSLNDIVGLKLSNEK